MLDIGGIGDRGRGGGVRGGGEERIDVGDVEATLRRDGGVSSEKAKLVANAYGKMRRTLERELKKYASSTSVKRLKEHRCRADYVVSTSASGEKREPTFHVSWLLSDGASGEDERINFTCDTEEMLHLVETLREACKASETIARARLERQPVFNI